VLPEPTSSRSRPRKYCRDGEGGFEQEYGISCAELGPAKEKYERVFGREAVAGADLERLGEQITAAQRLLGSDSAVAQLLAGLTGTLTGVGERLDGTVVDALDQSRRDQAAAREALGREAAAIIERDAANDLAQQEVLARQQADAKVRAANDRVEEHRQARQQAEVAQGRAEGERDLYKERAERAEEAAGRDREKLTEAQTQITALTTTVDTLRTQLDEARAEVDRVRTDSDRALQQLRTDTELQLTQARAGFAQRLAEATAASSAEIGRLGTEHAETLRRLEREHAAELAGHQQTASQAHHHLQRRLDTLRTGLRQLVRVDQRTVNTEPAQRADHLRTGLVDLLDDLDQQPDEPPGQ
jgi:DNA repair exonuclease SbcCD ATPase subunit